ncbi:MAG: hypothetical protein A3J46_02540 [Candidatus Yanofskybacteria bacterium RIFCSPHIGHO2_02_FULL_41_11]|uniref:DNA polymerase III subunit delta n=1 Tax=Candidatus Yanofskybacteria bacterium RIFCSPHIGHO2_02_FULL_41_11 TaxID=1802675 RepID=A0A1F8F6Y3_9BACT|nr:MAG: hypothetical protein A3J46_02540 [Candidatus Yanofskybacteria bacterium RIFCSPHIGHO2_02_FULL_41_11]
MNCFEKQKKYFENILHDNLLGHAYLFVGQDLKGKRLFAEDICMLLTGKNFDNNPDLRLIQPDTEKDIYKIYIEDIRDLKYFMSFKPYSSKYKLAVIDNADAMTIEAANSLLKILEEPPAKSVFFILSSKPRLLPKTVLSRCETVVFPPKPEIQTEEMNKALTELRKVAKQGMAERIKYAKKLHEKDDYAALVNLWLRSLRLQLSNKPTSAPILRRLLHLSYVISQPQYNHRLALENFLIQL